MTSCENQQYALLRILTAKESIVKVVEAHLAVEERKPLESCKICFFCSDQVTVYNNPVDWSFGSVVFFLAVLLSW